LEAWLQDQVDLPQALTEGARQLAQELDAAPRNSPLWARYVTLLGLLTNDWAEGRAIRAEAASLFERLSSAAGVETYRLARYREAADRGEDASRWDRLVPVGCVRGRHHWRRWDGGFTTCQDCDYVLEEPAP
jgi:hypothetical protein